MNDAITPDPRPHPNEATAVPVGALAPDFTLPDSQGRFLSLATGCAQGPLLLIFYRGDW